MTCELLAKTDCFRSYVKGISKTTVGVQNCLDTVTPRAVCKGSHPSCAPENRQNQKNREKIGLFHCLALKNWKKIGKWVGENIEILGQNIYP